MNLLITFRKSFKFWPWSFNLNVNFCCYLFYKKEALFRFRLILFISFTIGWFRRTYGHSRRWWTVGSGRCHILGYWLRITQSTRRLHKDNEVCWMDQPDYHLLKTTLRLSLQILHFSLWDERRKTRLGMLPKEFLLYVTTNIMKNCVGEICLLWNVS